MLLLAVAICARPPASIQPSARVLSEDFFDQAHAAQEHAAVDASLREAMNGPRLSMGRLETLVDAIHADADRASPKVLDEARDLRVKLRENMRARTASDGKTPTLSASTAHAADAALRKAMQAGEIEGLMDAIHANADIASPEVLDHARALRDELRDRKHAAAAAPKPYKHAAPMATDSSDVEFVIVAASPRSASTAVAEDIADHRCSISFNEMFNMRPGNLFHPQSMRRNARGCIYPEGAPCTSLPGGCNSKWYHQRLHHMLPALNLTRNAWCGRPNKGPDASPVASCNGKCVVAIKMFGPDMFRTPASRQVFDSYAHSFEELIAYKGTRLVIVERDAVDDECSYNYSRKSGMWHGGNKFAEHAWKANNCQLAPSAQFASAHREWYAWIRGKATQFGKKAFELPFETYVADEMAARQKLHALAELPAGPEFKQLECGHTPTLHQYRRKTRGGRPAGSPRRMDTFTCCECRSAGFISSPVNCPCSI